MKSIFNINEHISTFANSEFLVSKKRSLTFREFVDLVLTISQNLKAAGVKKDTVIILLNLPAFLFPAFLFALWKIEAIAFPINPKFSKESIDDIIVDSGADFVISTEESFNKNNHSGLCYKDLLSAKEELLPQDFNLNLKNTATIIMTSGSSGKAKYAVHSIANHFYSANGVNQFLSFGSGSSWLLSLPVYHVGGLAIIVRCFLAGACLFIAEGKDDLEKLLLWHCPTHISLVSTQLLRLMKYEESMDSLKKCKAILLGGSAIPGNLLSLALHHNLSIFTSYGLTEMSSTVAIGKVDQTNSLVKPLPFRELKINRENEILLKGECLFRGYVLNGKIVKVTDKIGWFNSGDFGRINSDGTFTVFGRKDNMFISGGENIYPEEIERCLLQIDDIEQAIVVLQENKEFGYRPLAFIKSQKKLDYKSVKKILRKKLVPFKIPDKFLEWPDELNDVDFKARRSDFLKYVK